MKLTKFFAFALTALAFVSCGGGSEVEKPFNSPLFLTVNDGEKVSLKIDDVATFKVTDENGNDVTAQATIFGLEKEGMTTYEDATFTATKTGKYEFFATLGTQNSNYVTISVLAEMLDYVTDPQPENLKFNHRVLLIDHTGVNCGYCPVVVEVFRSLKSRPSHQHYNEVTVHAGGYATGDPANSQAANIVNQFHSPQGYPDVRLNFYGGNVGNTVASFEAALDRYIKKGGADVGISMAVAGDSSTIYCAAQVKAKVAQEYKVVAWLLESGIYSPNQASNIGNKDYYKIYDFALRNISGTYSRANISGESIGVLEEGKTHDCTFELPITSTKWNWEKMGVLVIVSTKTNSGSWEIANTAYCSLDDEAKAYEYVE